MAKENKQNKKSAKTYISPAFSNEFNSTKGEKIIKEIESFYSDINNQGTEEVHLSGLHSNFLVRNENLMDSETDENYYISIRSVPAINGLRKVTAYISLRNNVSFIKENDVDSDEHRIEKATLTRPMNAAVSVVVKAPSTKEVLKKFFYLKLKNVCNENIMGDFIFEIKVTKDSEKQMDITEELFNYANDFSFLKPRLSEDVKPTYGLGKYKEKELQSNERIYSTVNLPSSEIVKNIEQIPEDALFVFSKINSEENVSVSALYNGLIIKGNYEMNEQLPTILQEKIKKEYIKNRLRIVTGNNTDELLVSLHFLIRTKTILLKGQSDYGTDMKRIIHTEKSMIRALIQHLGQKNIPEFLFHIDNIYFLEQGLKTKVNYYNPYETGSYFGLSSTFFPSNRRVSLTYIENNSIKDIAVFETFLKNVEFFFNSEEEDAKNKLFRVIKGMTFYPHLKWIPEERTFLCDMDSFDFKDEKEIRKAMSELNHEVALLIKLSEIYLLTTDGLRDKG